MNNFYINGQLDVDLFEKFYRENPIVDSYTPEQKKAYDDYIAICKMHEHDLDFISRHPIANIALKSIISGAIVGSAMSIPAQFMKGSIVAANNNLINDYEIKNPSADISNDPFINNIKDFLQQYAGNKYMQMFYDFIGRHPYVSTGGAVAIAAFGSWLIYKGLFALYRKWKEYCAEQNFPVVKEE